MFIINRDIRNILDNSNPNFLYHKNNIIDINHFEEMYE